MTAGRIAMTVIQINMKNTIEVTQNGSGSTVKNTTTGMWISVGTADKTITIA